MTMDDLWWVSLAECREHLLAEENYGHGLYERRIAKGLPTKEKTVAQHKASWEFWQELYCYKLLTDQGYHASLYVIKPRWEQDYAYAWWRTFFSYSWQGAKTDRKPKYDDGEKE